MKNLNTLTIVASVALTSAAVGDTAYVVSEKGRDLNGDSVPELIKAAPFGEGNSVPSTDPGVVHLYSGSVDTGNLLVTFHGVQADDRLGASHAFVGDLRSDGHEDIVIGSPGANVAYVIDGPFVEPCLVDILISEAGTPISSPDEELFDFGFEVAPLYDFDEDGYVDFRVAGRYIDASGEQRTRTYIFSGFSRIPIARVEPASPTSHIAAIPEDTDGNATVDSQDLATVIDNLGSSDPAGKADGDVDDNGAVDGTDLVSALSSQGATVYKPSPVEPPPGLICEPIEGCASYAAQDALGEWMCVTWMNCHEWYVVALEVDGEIEFELQEPAAESLASVDSFAQAPGWKAECQQQISWCLGSTNGQPNSPLVRAAMMLIQQRCGSMLGGGLLKIKPGQCPPGVGGGAKPICEGGERKAEILVCCPLTNCAVLAHELIHVSQYCEMGLFDPAVPCEDFRSTWEDQWNAMCAELEAYKLTGACHYQDPGGGGLIYDHAACCEAACNSADPHWTQCEFDCFSCCDLMAETCCVGWQNICVPPEAYCPPGW